MLRKGKRKKEGTKRKCKKTEVGAQPEYNHKKKKKHPHSTSDIVQWVAL